MSDIEVWESIAGYEGWYEVSNLGRVRSCDRTIEQWSMYGHTIQRRLKGKLIHGNDNGNGYLVVNLRKNQKRESCYIHRLVAEAFIENPCGKPEINHIDANKKNNCVTNLEWCTRSENIACAVPHMRHPKNGRPTKTGEKYITLKKGRYRLGMGKVCDRSYKTLEEAVAAREVITDGGQHYAR